MCFRKMAKNWPLQSIHRSWNLTWALWVTLNIFNTLSLTAVFMVFSITSFGGCSKVSLPNSWIRMVISFCLFASFCFRFSGISEVHFFAGIVLFLFLPLVLDLPLCCSVLYSLPACKKFYLYNQIIMNNLEIKGASMLL